jgi:hypothetical protein
MEPANWIPIKFNWLFAVKSDNKKILINETLTYLQNLKCRCILIKWSVSNEDQTKLLILMFYIGMNWICCCNKCNVIKYNFKIKVNDNNLQKKIFYWFKQKTIKVFFFSGSTPSFIYHLRIIVLLIFAKYWRTWFIT